MNVPTVLFLLVHSPLVGPMTWTPVAEALKTAGCEVVAPRLDSPPHIEGTYWDRHARIVAESVAAVPQDRAIILVGHSGAGPLLPAIREAMRRKVSGYIFFDAGLPRDGASRLDLFDTAAEVKEFRAAAVNGVLPKWTDDDLRTSINDDALRRAFVAELPALPLAVYEEPLPVFKAWPDAPCAYVRTSATYDPFLEAARKKGWPVRTLDGGHFYMMNEPGHAAALLQELAAAMLPDRPPAPGSISSEPMRKLQVAALDEMARTVSAGDAGGYARLYADDAVITVYGGKSLTGRAAIEAYEVELLRQYPGARLAFHDVWERGTLAVVHYAVIGPTPGGPSMGHEGLLFYRFQPSGLIKEERRYNDSLTPMAQMGALGPGPARPLPDLPREMKAHVATGSAEERDNVALVKACLGALDARNEAAFLSTLSDNVTVDEMIEPQPFVGRQNVKAWYARWATAVPDGRTEITNILGAGDFVLLETVVSGTLKRPLGRLAASNKPFAVHRAMIVEAKNGKIVRIAAFMNGKELAEATGQWPLAAGSR